MVLLYSQFGFTEKVVIGDSELCQSMSDSALRKSARSLTPLSGSALCLSAPSLCETVFVRVNSGSALFLSAGSLCRTVFFRVNSDSALCWSAPSLCRTVFVRVNSGSALFLSAGSLCRTVFFRVNSDSALCLSAGSQQVKSAKLKATLKCEILKLES